MRKKTNQKLAAALLGSLLAVSSSFGALIEIGETIKQTRDLGLSQVIGKNVHVYHTDIKNAQGQVVDQYVKAGMFKFQFENLNGPAGVQEIGTFCTDVGAHAGSINQLYSAERFSQSSEPGVTPDWANHPIGIQNAAWLYNMKYQATFDYPDPDKTGPLGPPSEVLAAGLQLAIWEVLYDSPDSSFNYNWNPFDITQTGTGKGSFYTGLTSGDVLTAANGFLSELVAARKDFTSFQTFDSTWLRPVDANGNTVTAQGLLYDYVARPVPEPTTILAGMLLLLPFGYSTLRRRRA